MMIPKPWRDALQTIRAVLPDAVMGGGCLRDLDNGRPVKDIDIFVRGSSALDLYGIRDRLMNAFIDCDEIDTLTMYPVGDGNDLIGFVEVKFPDVEYPVQVIMTSWMTDQITERFDYGICRISFDGEAVYRHADYAKDQRDQVFRLCRDRQGEELAASVHRYARLVQKYEGWKFRPFDEFDFHNAVAAQSTSDWGLS